MGPAFWQTPMGHRFYEHTLPELVKQMGRIADALEALLANVAKKDQESKR